MATETKTNVDEFLKQYNLINSTSGSVVITNSDGFIIKVLQEDLIKQYSAELVDFLINNTRKYKDFGMAQATLKQLIEVKKAWWPAAQTNRNLNVNVFDEQLKKWFEVRQSIKESSKDEIEKEILVTIDKSYKDEEENNGK